ncbi:MAG: alpha-amylase [Treponema sp.]|nr:alpha-amylase [Treponema sp.]
MKKYSYNEFHISRAVRDACNFPQELYQSSGNVILANIGAVRSFALKFNKYLVSQNQVQVSAGTLNAMGLLDEIFHLACYVYRRQRYPNAFKELLSDLKASLGDDKIESLLVQFCTEFPPTCVYKGECTVEEYLNTEMTERKTGRVRTNREQTLEEMVMLHMANENPAFKPFSIMFDESNLKENETYNKAWKQIQAFFKKLPYFGTFGHDLISFLREPILFAPENLQEQLDYVRVHWAELFIPGEGEGEDYWLKRLFGGIDILSEEWKPEWHPTNGGSPDMSPPNYDYLMREYERFSADSDWMPKVVLMAKTVLVWLFQLSKKYNREIRRLDQIPDEELDILRDEGFTALWLIGIWERSSASQRIKQICGNPEAAASAYSLEDYEIAENLGGWRSLENLRTRLWQRGIRLASDMVPNHTGMDARWVVEKPDLFVQRRDNPFPQYTFNGVNLSHDSRVAIYLEDHYYSKNDCAVVFKRVDTQTGDTRYIYHGNDGTGMPWNDTAQIDFLNPAAREEVMQKILHVARNFPIIRFDAAMVLAKKHIKRLWYPEPGKGGDIATRSEFALSAKQFEDAIPQEFWREVVDRVAREVPDTLLLAEAFWMMEGYFTRTLGMHRVYNSAFMNMLKKEENFKYRATVKNTIQFDPQVLKRYVNFMNNPDEETAVAQFGKGDKYFGVCTLMCTMPGLPMFGHGQLEGFEEKYGMEYTRAYRDETPDGYLMERHKREIFPLLHKRYLFSGVEDFLFYDVWNNGVVNENIFAYSNRAGSEYSVVFYNNKYERASGWIKQSCEYAVKIGSGDNDKKMVSRSLAEGLGLQNRDDYYVIFREQRSGLWFIRNCRKIHEEGMFVGLNGFETQVLLEFRQQQDIDGKLSTLCNFLNGRGIADLEIAWQELHYKELYEAFSGIFTDEFESALKSLVMTTKELRKAKLKRATAKSIFALVEQPALKFYEKALETASEEIAKSNSKKRVRKFPAKEKILAQFRRKLCQIVRVATEIRKNAPVVEKEIAVNTKSVNTFLAGGLLNQKEGVAFAVLYSLFAEFALRGFATKWALYRKISEFFRSASVSDNFTYNFFQRLFIISSSKLPKLDSKETEEESNCIAAEILAGAASWLLIGANEYDGTVWFNKELMESSLFMVHEVLILGAGKQKASKALRMFKKLSLLSENSDYKVKEFVSAFENIKE